MGCSQSKSPNEILEPPKPINGYGSKPDILKANTANASSSSREESKDAVFDLPNMLAESPCTLDLHTMLRTNSVNSADGFSKAMVHIETANTSDDNPYGKPIEHFYDGIFDGKILGTGIAGIVRECVHKKTGHKYAVKCLDLDHIGNERGLEYLKSEILIMSELDHPSIVRLEEVYESPSEIYLVQELCSGGELFDRLEDQEDYHYSEGECARLVGQMLSSIRYIHSKGIVHRDLKLENFLFSTKEDSELKLIDFGLSKHFNLVEGGIMDELVGSPYTIAPETIKGRYDERVDLWAIGVITYLLLSGETPFGGCGGEEPLLEVRDNILCGKYEFLPEYIWKNVSDSAKQFIIELLKVNPEERMTSAEKAQQHPWIVEWSAKARKGSKSDHMLSPNVIKNLIDFKGYGSMRKLLCEVLSFTLLPDQIQELKQDFEILDVDGSGEITMESLKKVLKSSAAAGSLGALLDEEVEDIFDAMRVQKSETTTIRWHEFIAACLNMCRVDDKNLRIAFDRLDSDHKGFINLEDVLNLMGYEDLEEIENMRLVYKEEMIVNGESKVEGVEFEDFVLLMKGQTRNNAKFREDMDNEIFGKGNSHSRRNSKCLPDLNTDNLSPLELNRNLYRCHRQMRRQSVLDASKRFEELHAKRTLHHACLISSKIDEEPLRRQSCMVDKRPRRARRTRTNSDISGMMLPSSPLIGRNHHNVSTNSSSQQGLDIDFCNINEYD